VKAPDLAYLRAESLDEALAALAHHGEQAMVLAGGQSLIAMHNLRVARAGVLVDINRVPGLDAIVDAGDQLRIGARVRHAELLASARVRAHAPLLSLALPHVAHEAVRNRGTLGGSLALADPAAELPACCLALGATLIAVSVRGERAIPAERFFEGLYTTALEPGELLREVRVPKAGEDAVAAFDELARRRGDFAIAGAALSARHEQGVLRAPRLALLGVGDRPLLARAAMALLDGAVPVQVDADALGAALARDADPLDEPGIPAAYRRHALAVLVRRMLARLHGTGT